MDIFGMVAFIIVLTYIGIPDKIKKLKQRIRKIERELGFKEKGELVMSKMLEELKGQECIIKVKDSLMNLGSNSIKCKIIDVEEEWIKFKVYKKKTEKIRIIRIEDISEVEKEN